MRDLKIKPGMDTPKARLKNPAPKDADSILKQHMDKRKSEKEPDSRDPVRYATERVEKNMRRGAELAADSSRRMIKREREKRKENGKRNTPQSSNRVPIEQFSADAPASGFADTPLEYEDFTSARNDIGSTAASTQYPRRIDNPTAAPRERGRQKAAQDAKAAYRRNLAEKRITESPFMPPRSDRGGMTPPPRASIPGTAAKNGSMPKRRQSAFKAVRRTAHTPSTAESAQPMQSLTQRAQAAGRALRAILSAARSLAAAMMAGGSTVLSLVLVVCLIGLLIASPFGIFFSGEDSGTGYTMPEAVTMLNTEFTDRIERIKAENSYDELDMDNAGSAAMVANWRDVLAIYAVRTTTDRSSPDEVATLTEEKLDILRQIFWDMNAISYWVETVSGGEDEDDTVILHIRVTVKDHLQMAEEYHFTVEQKKLLEELMQPEYEELFMRLTGSYQDIALSDREVAEIVKKLPDDLSEERKQVVLTTYQLLGKVNYFWGGKSLVIGWDSRWGTPMEVTAAGSSTTGTVRPFGLDCSGFVDWVFYNVTGGSYVIGHGGEASAQHGYCTAISWSDAQPGDLVFYPGDSHVGIVCGFDGSGNVLIIHCASGYNNVVVTGKNGFTSIGRPTYYAD